ncbi:MAG TPA: D-alanyl-D-alanine carboxypeptidase/D-alanyl-D-alanine-endopeptidase, partial [Aquihabitans sp.]|nr:D-alanyl-D-alanine carboxypeptidase/D-alanyl-D-alanine-endopeptidase [Aquihabitans sp.]
MPAHRPPRHRRGLRAAAAATAALLAGLAPATAQADPTAEAGALDRVGRPAQQPAPADDAELRRALDAVVAYSPPDTCLAVAIDGVAVYGHDDEQPLVPASVEKLFTARVALDVLGADARFETQVVAASPPVDGVLQGDLTLVGGGDPMLVTDAYREVVRLAPDRPTTRFDDLADQLVAAGVRRVSGRVVGDEARYDQVRTGPTWPERYTTTQQQSGPLSALEVDDGYVLVGPPIGVEGPVGRERAPDPAANAARLLTERLVIRGVQVDGAAFPGPGRAPEGAVRLAGVTSPPVGEIVDHVLRASDNQAAELLTKEIGRVTGGGGSTEAGTAAIDRRLGELGVERTGADAVDGSGLDPTNRATCASIVSVLDSSGGAAGPLATGLPVAGRSGTLGDRFRGTPAEGRLRAKTGSLNSVTSLAGFVDLQEGGTATFAYVANGRPVDADVLRAQDLLAAVLGGYLPPCPAPGAGGLVAPLAPYAAQVGTLAMFPLQSVLLPGAVLPLHVFEDRYRALVDRCLALQEDFGVALISRGSEVGGDDVRTD